MSEKIISLEDGEVLRVHTKHGMVTISPDEDQTGVYLSANRIGRHISTIHSDERTAILHFK